MRRALWTFAAALALAAPLGSAAAAHGQDVTVKLASGGTKSVTLTPGEEDIVEREYTVRSGSGERKETVTGFSLAWVLEQAGVDLYAFGYVEIERNGGPPVYLDNAQARNEGNGVYADGPPVVWRQGGQTRFLRPSAEASDRNAGDIFGVDSLRIRVRNGQLINVKASASRYRVKPGQPVTFTAQVDRAQSGMELKYSWTFRDGQTGSGPKVTHRFEQRGEYNVLVGVTTATDDTGGFDSVTVVVGKPRKKGPDRQGGGRNRDKRAPESGPSDSGQGAGPAHAGDPDDGGGPDAPQDETERKPAPGVEPVEGELLDPDATVAVAEEQPSVSARTGHLTEEDEKGFNLPAGVWGVLLSGALLSTGALRELGKLPQPKGRDPWS